MGVTLHVDGRQVEVADERTSLLDALRDVAGARTPKDGCSPQGQCGCCTVLVDGQPRVACVTPVRRVSGREVTTLDGLDPELTTTWAEAFCATGASQCGFCTPGIVVRLEGLRARGTPAEDVPAVERALAAHLCRCTGWRSILDAWDLVAGAVPAGASTAGVFPSGRGRRGDAPASGRFVDPTAVGSTAHGSVGGSASRPSLVPAWPDGRDPDAASRRAAIEGGTAQQVGPHVALGAAGFAADTAPPGALVAVPDGSGGWAVGETLADARAAAGKVQGRRTTVAPTPPLAVPDGDWALRLRTSWVEPAYLETDAAWCEPGGVPVGPLANGGAFGAKQTSPVVAAARRLADEHGRAVLAVLAREDAVRLGPKRPPVAGGVRADGSGVLRVARTPGVAEAIAAVAPGLVVEEVAVPGPPTSMALRGAGWFEAAVLVGAAAGATEVRSPAGAVAEADVAADGSVDVRMACGEVLDEVVLRSYGTGAAHMALSWVTSEGLAVAPDGEVLDLTVRSFGVLRAADTPPVRIHLDGGSGPAVNGSDAVLAAVALAVWRHQGLPSTWPTGRPLRSG